METFSRSWPRVFQAGPSVTLISCRGWCCDGAKLDNTSRSQKKDLKSPNQVMLMPTYSHSWYIQNSQQSIFQSSAKSTYFTLELLLLTANMHEEKGRDTKHTTLLLTLPPQFSFPWTWIWLEALFWNLLNLTPNLPSQYCIVSSQ